MTISSPAIDLDAIALLLDVDGTLVDIAPTPREVWVPPLLRDTLARLWELTGGALAFVSGRPVSELDLLFTPLQLPAIGGHGAELRIAAGNTPQQIRVPPLDSSIKRKLAAIAEAAPGIIVEDKGYSLALHYRLAPDMESLVQKCVAAVCAESPNHAIELLRGKLMVEIKQVGFNKGSAVRDLMSHAPFDGRRPIFIGDDTTDADAFAVMPEFEGIGIAVGGQFANAQNLFMQPAEVRSWLHKLSQHDAPDLQ